MPRTLPTERSPDCPYKMLIEHRLRARGFAAQQTEAGIGVAVLNQMLAARRPKSIRRQRVVIESFGA